MQAVVLALAASLSYGVGDFIGGVETRRTSLWTVLVVTQTTGLLLMLLIVLVRGVPLPREVVLPALVAGLLMVVFATAYFKALAIGMISIVGPVVALGVAVPVIVGFARGERPSTLQVAGIAVAVAGVVLASREKTADEQRKGTSRASIALALLAGAAYGIVMVLYARGADADPYWTITLSRLTSTVIFLAAFAVVRPGLKAGRRDIAPLLTTGVCGVAAYTLFSVATTFAYLSIVSVLGSLYPVFMALLAYVFLHERLTRTQLAGVVAALAGVALISAG